MKANICQEENSHCTTVTATDTRSANGSRQNQSSRVIFREVDANPNIIYFEDLMYDHKLKSLQAAVYTIRKGLGGDTDGKYSHFVL